MDRTFYLNINYSSGESIEANGNMMPEHYEEAEEKLTRLLLEYIRERQAALSTPFETAAMTVLALCVYPKNKDLSLQMLEYLRGPRPMNGMEKQFIADRFRGKEYVPRSYFQGAVPGNDYRPSRPYTISVSENTCSYEESGFAKLFIPSGGADSPRPVKLRLAKDGKWYLWEQALLTGIREPESNWRVGTGTLGIIWET